MKTFRYLSIIFIPLFVVGCSFTINIPSATKTGETQTMTMTQPLFAGASESDVTIEMGAGKLSVTGGSSQLVDGTIQYNVADWKPTISTSGTSLVISQNHTSNIVVPGSNIKNDWNLKLGSVPISLQISAGAYEGTLNLSGLSLTNLEISDGASQATVRFDSLNPVNMQHFTYKTGASAVKLLGLRNANVSDLVFESGAGDYTLDFTGSQSRDLSARIMSGLSQVKVILPKNSQTMVNISGGLGNVNAEGTWTINGTSYSFGNSGPKITINVTMTVGNLILQQQ